MSSQEIISHFLKKSMIKWKLFKENPTLPWKFPRCASCSTPLFSKNYSNCSSCYKKWDDEQMEQLRRFEEEEDVIEYPCQNCGGESEDGPCRGFCSRMCLREWSRD